MSVFIPPQVRAKFFVSEIKHGYSPSPDATMANIVLQPCFGTYPGGDSEENKSFSKWTPQGKIELTITNPSAIAAFELGKAYYIDFTPA